MMERGGRTEHLVAYLSGLLDVGSEATVQGGEALAGAPITVTVDEVGQIIWGAPRTAAPGVRVTLPNHKTVLIVTASREDAEALLARAAEFAALPKEADVVPETRKETEA